MTDPDPAPIASLIVVNYNGAGRITECVESLARDAEPSREIVVVDNASSDASPGELRALEARMPGLRVVWNEANAGYAGAVDAALPLCRGRLIGVFNMDLVAEPGWLGPLVRFLDEHPEVGAANPLLLLEDGARVNATGQAIHVTGLGFNRALDAPRESVPAEPFPVAGIQGAAFVVPRAVFEKSQGLDASGFLYHEDVNLSWLLRMLGYELYCVPASACRHDYFLSMHADKFHLLERNRWALLLAYLETASFVRLAPWLAITELMTLGYALLRGPAFVRAKLAGYAWLFRTRAPRRERRAWIQAARVRRDREVFRAYTYGYAWTQLVTLARERGPARRVFGLAKGE